MTIFHYLYQHEQTLQRGKGSQPLTLSPRYFNKQEFPEKVVQLIKVLVNEVFVK